MPTRKDIAPIFFDIAKKTDATKLRHLRKNTFVAVVDTCTDSIDEWCEITHPHLRGKPEELAREKKLFRKEVLKNVSPEAWGTWVYFPWRNLLVHIPPQKVYEELRTARNRNLITQGEQIQYRDCPIAVIGLSVGSHAAASIVMQGGAERIRIADPDILSISNMNRVRTGVGNVGREKAVLLAQELFEMNPYLKPTVWSKRITEKNVESFLLKPKPVKVIIEEIDHLPTKLLIRAVAKKHGIPVIMATDNGDGVILDIERYDTEPKTEPFGGRLHGVSVVKADKATPQELVTMMANMIDPTVITPRMMSSARVMGKELYSWPQLGGAAQMSGVVLAYAARMIATGGPLKSGRTIIACEDLLSFNSLT